MALTPATAWEPSSETAATIATASLVSLPMVAFLRRGLVGVQRHRRCDWPPTRPFRLMSSVTSAASIEGKSSDNCNGGDWRSQPPYQAAARRDAKYRAGCFCKRVRFQTDSQPIASQLCECSQCARLHGTQSRWSVVFQKDAIQFEETTCLRWYSPSLDEAWDDGEQRVLPCKVQCAHCGTWVMDENEGTIVTCPSLFNVAAEDLPHSFLPTRRVFCSSRSMLIDNSIPRFVDGGKTPRSLADFLAAIAPRLDGSGHKGQAGRIGVLGGSVDYAGAPYYAGMAALRVGAELLYLCTAEEACGPIKVYSPELMVSEVYRWSHMSSEDASIVEEEQRRLVDRMGTFMDRFHAMVIGPGLGRDDRVLQAVALVIRAARQRGIPTVVDADGLWLIERQPELVRGYDRCVLTPNAAEFRRLSQAFLDNSNASVEELSEVLDGPVVVQKGPKDVICCAGAGRPLVCEEEGGPRRPGGLGDILAGSTAVFVAWAVLRSHDTRWACLAACTLLRRACKTAFTKRKRSMVAPDVLEEVGASFDDLCNSRSEL